MDAQITVNIRRTKVDTNTETVKGNTEENCLQCFSSSHSLDNRYPNQ